MKEGELHAKLLEIEFAAEQAHADVNPEEAKHPSLFVSGWRLAIGWIGAIVIGFNYVMGPLITWVGTTLF